MLPPETKLTRHCESCGVSPEDCLKKLGLHSDHVGLLSPSPKSERLLHFFRNIQPVPPRPHPCHTPIGSDPHLEKSHQEAPRPQSRSLTTSPTHSEDDSRKPRLNTF
ncbi:hypothetical protein Hamer_G023012 [Homarus americanus]|uniref:Uncharacterized protein n=2 Tax=Homarus americanus TaxID=6706 RepID=A0A8J5JHC7_HOMAM|nr:hypothetical protein Hamer_G023012 [Homarus americanus]